MSRFATHARTRFSAPPATARGEVSLRLRRAALRVRSHSGCAAWWARSCRLQPELRANCRAGRARVPARGGFSLRSGGRQGTVYRRGPSARVPARGVSLRPGGWQGIDRRRGGRARARASAGRDGCHEGAQHSGRAARQERSTALSVQTSKQRSAPNLGVKGPEQVAAAYSQSCARVVFARAPPVAEDRNRVRV
jgi:hypothetical protein